MIIFNKVIHFNQSRSLIYDCKALSATAFTPNNDCIIIGGSEGGVLALPIARSSIRNRLENVHTEKISCVRVAPSYQLYATASHDNTIKIFDASKDQEVKHLNNLHTGILT